MSAVGPSQGAKAPSGGSAAAPAASVGAGMSAAGPPQGAKAPSGGREAQPNVGADSMSATGPSQGAKAPSGGSAVHDVTSVGAP